MRPVLLLLLLPACSSAESAREASWPDGQDGGLVATADAQDDGGAPADAAPSEVGIGADAGGLGEWRALAPLPRGPRQETAVVELAGEVWVLGGFDGAQRMVAVVEIYDPARDAWRQGPDLPEPLHHAHAAVVEGRLYVLGYLVGGFREVGRVFRLDPALGVWEERAPLPAGRERGGGAAVAVGARIWVIGGLRGLTSVADVDEYDPVMDVWSPLPPIPRTVDHLAAGLVAGRVLAVGGRSGGIGGHVARLDVRAPGAGDWGAGPPMPTSRGGMAAAVLGERLFVFGGEGDRSSATGVFSQVEVFHAGAQEWRVLPPMRSPRHGTQAAAVGDRIYLPGGADRQAFAAVDTMEVFIPPP